MDLISILIGRDLAANTGNVIWVPIVYSLSAILRRLIRFSGANNRDETIVGIGESKLEK